MTKNKRNINQELLESIEHVKAYKRGEMQFRTTIVTRKEMTSPKAIRARLNLTQEQFATRLRVSVRTLQAWEQGRRAPSGPALALLRIAEQEPDVFLRIVP
jgi:putative transcriptional regulator